MIRQDSHLNCKKNICKIPVILFAIILAAWYFSTYWYQLMLIQGESMEPSYHNLQVVIVDKTSREYKINNVIAFKCIDLSTVLVKRVIAVPGDTVQIVNGSLLVNASPSLFYSDQIFEYAGLLENMVMLKTDEYLVLGDNIAESIDSRYGSVGIVRLESIIGKVI